MQSQLSLSGLCSASPAVPADSRAPAPALTAPLAARKDNRFNPGDGAMVEPGQMIGAYRVLRKLGEGGMGEVFEAVQEAIDRHVAIKVLHPEYALRQEYISRFFNETSRPIFRRDLAGLGGAGNGRGTGTWTTKQLACSQTYLLGATGGRESRLRIHHAARRSHLVTQAFGENGKGGRRRLQLGG